MYADTILIPFAKGGIKDRTNHQHDQAKKLSKRRSCGSEATYLIPLG